MRATLNHLQKRKASLLVDAPPNAPATTAVKPTAARDLLADSEMGPRTGTAPSASNLAPGNGLSLRLPAGLPRGVTQQALNTFVESQKDAQWFTGKGREIKRVDFAERAPVDVMHGTSGTRYELAVLDVKYGDGGNDLFHVPLAIAKTGEISDALLDPAFVRSMVDAARDDRDIKSTSGAVHARSVEGTALPSESSTLPVKAMGVPQSNVSIKVGDAVMFKAYRKPEPGVSIEREVTEHLTRQQYANTPQLLGTLTIDSKTGPMTIGMIFELVKSDGDGWKNTLARLGQLGEQGAAESLMKSVELLGKRIGEMHLALGAPVDDPAFKPQDVTRADLQAWASAIRRELDETIALAKQSDPALGAKLESVKPQLLARLDKIEELDGAGMKMRIHGDLHLGQVLHREGDWLVLDFEGEPARTKEERRGLYTPLRDVAGMLRSYAYAEAESRKQGNAVPLDWAKQAGAAFLDAYRDATKDSGLLPKDADAFSALLSAVELEKALYEVRYELKSRPDMVDIPALRVIEMAAPSHCA